MQHLFPAKASADLAAGARRLLKELRAAGKLPADQRHVKLGELDEQLQELLDSVEDGHGLRLDGTIEHPASGGQVWFDVSAVHTTCKTHLKKEVKLTRERRAAGQEAAGMQSATLMEAHQDKLDRYALLEAMLERQVLDGLRADTPLILPAVVTTHGEFCPGTVQLQEWLEERFRERLRLAGDRDDGETEDSLVTAFRCELRASLLVATAKGTAEMLLVAGRPFRKDRVHDSGAEPRTFAGDVTVVSDSDTAADSDSSTDARGSGDSDSSITQTSSSENDDSDSGDCGSSGPRGPSKRSTAPHAQTQPRAGTRSSARLARRSSTQPDPNSTPGLLRRPGISSHSSGSCSTSSCSSSSSVCSSSGSSNSVGSSVHSGEFVAGAIQDQRFPIIHSP